MRTLVCACIAERRRAIVSQSDKLYDYNRSDENATACSKHLRLLLMCPSYSHIPGCMCARARVCISLSLSLSLSVCLSVSLSVPPLCVLESGAVSVVWPIAHTCVFDPRQWQGTVVQDMKMQANEGQGEQQHRGTGRVARRQR